MANIYTEQDERDAKNFVISRIYAENELDLEIRRLIRDAVKEITTISLRYNISPREFRFSANERLERNVDEVIRRLREAILDLTLKYAVLEGEDAEEAEDHLLAPVNGKTFRQRVAIYCDRMKYEIEAGIASALIVGRRKNSEISTRVYKFIRTPYANPDIKEAIKRGGASAARLVTGGVSYGIGRSNVMYNALSVLYRHSVAETRMWQFYRRKRREGAYAFAVKRGSLYPCAMCDQETTYLHIEGDPLPPFHPHCVCIAIPVYL